MENLSQTRALLESDGQLRAVFFNSKKWEVGSTIKIAFIGGTDNQRKHTRKVADTWTKYANLTFEWDVAVAESHVRISFEQGKGSWSYLGTDARGIDKSRATMNFGWMPESPKSSDQGTILHEFGHMLGLAHEHQNPKGGLTWKRDVVIASLSGPPNNWTVPQIESNVLRKYDASKHNITVTDFDAESIMLYYFPASWNEEGIETKRNGALSTIDKRNIAEMYPGREPESGCLAFIRACVQAIKDRRAR